MKIFFGAPPKIWEDKAFLSEPPYKIPLDPPFLKGS